MRGGGSGAQLTGSQTCYTMLSISSNRAQYSLQMMVLTSEIESTLPGDVQGVSVHFQTPYELKVTAASTQCTYLVSEHKVGALPRQRVKHLRSPALPP